MKSHKEREWPCASLRFFPATLLICIMGLSGYHILQAEPLSSTTLIDFHITNWRGENELTWNFRSYKRRQLITIVRNNERYPRSIYDGLEIYRGIDKVAHDCCQGANQLFYYTAFDSRSQQVLARATARYTRYRSSPCRYIAHAAGAIRELTYTNSLDAFEHNIRRGFRCFEFDGSITADRKLAVVHDWGVIYKTYFNISHRTEVPTHRQFVRQDMKYSLQQLSYHDILSEASRNTRLNIITDIKRQNTLGLGYLSALIRRMKNYRLFDRVIPEIFNLYHYAEAKKLGFRNIMLSLYNTDFTDQEIIDFVNKRKFLYGVAMPHEKYLNSPELIQELNKVDIYIHTINNERIARQFRRKGIGIYTDFLPPRRSGR